MNTLILSLLGASFVFCGCDSAAERLDEANLQPYTNIVPGTTVRVQMRGQGYDYTQTDALGHPRQFDAKFGGQYILIRISRGTVGLRKTNETKTMYFSGRMIQSITPEKK